MTRKESFLGRFLTARNNIIQSNKNIKKWEVVKNWPKKKTMHKTAVWAECRSYILTGLLWIVEGKVLSAICWISGALTDQFEAVPGRQLHCAKTWKHYCHSCSQAPGVLLAIFCLVLPSEFPRDTRCEICCSEIQFDLGRGSEGRLHPSVFWPGMGCTKSWGAKSEYAVTHILSAQRVWADWRHVPRAAKLADAPSLRLCHLSWLTGLPKLVGLKLGKYCEEHMILFVLLLISLQILFREIFTRQRANSFTNHVSNLELLTQYESPNQDTLALDQLF